MHGSADGNNCVITMMVESILAFYFQQSSSHLCMHRTNSYKDINDGFELDTTQSATSSNIIDLQCNPHFIASTERAY